VAARTDFGGGWAVDKYTGTLEYCFFFVAICHDRTSNDKAYHINDSNDNDNDNDKQATSNNLPVDTTQLASQATATSSQQHTVKAAARVALQQFWQGVMAAAGGGGGVSQRLGENAKKFKRRRR